MKIISKVKGVSTLCTMLVMLMLLAVSPGMMAISKRYYNKIGKSHPRLIIKQGEENVIREACKRDSIVSITNARIIEDARRIMKQEPPKYELEGIRLSSRCLAIPMDIPFLAYAYRMTGEKEFADYAIREMMEIAAYPDWNPKHLLGTASVTLGMAIGYDWLYKELSKKQRKTIRRAIVNKGLNAGLAAPIGYIYNNEGNWNQVCNAGLVYGALATYEDNKSLSRTIVDKAVESNPKAMKIYGPDGGYPEGCDYWIYGTSYEILLLDALSRTFGTDFGLSEIPGFLQSAYFMQHTKGPSGECFNYSDSELKLNGETMMYWFAERLDDPSLVWLDRKKLLNPRRVLYEPVVAPMFVIKAAQLGSERIAEPTDDFWFNRGVMPVFTYRSGWSSPNDAFLAVKGGTGNYSHAHLDAGSFVYEKDGVRWAHDLGHNNYNNLEQAGIRADDYKSGGDRWKVFRYINQAHNTLTANDLAYIPTARAEITDTFCNVNRKGARIDLTDVMANGLGSSVRDIWLDKANNLHVEDKIKALASQPGEIMWVMQTKADAELTGNSIILKSGNKRMKLQATVPGHEVEYKIWSDEPPHKYDDPNPGYRRVGYVIKLQPGESAVLTTDLSSYK